MKLFVITKKSQVRFQFVYSLKAIKRVNAVFYNGMSSICQNLECENRYECNFHFFWARAI